MTNDNPEIEDAEIVGEEIDPIVEEIQELMVTNNARLNPLAMQGIEINVLALALRVLTEQLIPDPDQQRLMDLRFQERLPEVLSEAESQVDRINLERGRAQAGGIIVPGGPLPGT